MRSSQIESVSVINVLIVDPRPEDYTRLTEAAHELQLTVREARDGQCALKLAQQATVSLWVTNISLPDMSGLDLLELVRARRPDAPCLIVSDSYSAHDEVAARTAGASAYLCKPVDTVWLRLCRSTVSRSASRKGAPRSVS